MVYGQTINHHCAYALNRFELNSVSLQSVLGAWYGLPERDHVARVGFWTNVLYTLGHVRILTVWMLARNVQVMNFIHAPRGE